MIFQKNDVEIQRFDADRQFLEVPYFNNAVCADELFFQSISQDSPFKDKIVPNSLRAIDWKRGRPYVYRKEDFSLLMESDKLFARKFSTNVDSEIIDMICAQVGAT